jgi:anti-sigma factor RsiW
VSAHLGRALTAYVDGELDHARRGEVQVHLAHCASCRTELDGLRSYKSVVRQDFLAVPPDLSLRLLAATTTVGRPHVLPRPVAPRRPVVHGRIRRTALSAGLAALGIGGALVAAGPPPSGPLAPIDPTSAGLMIEHVSTVQELPFAGADVVPVAVPGR